MHFDLDEYRSDVFDHDKKNRIYFTLPFFQLGFVDIEELIFETDDYDENKWNLLLWSLNFNPRIQYELRDIPKPYILTVLALLFLYQVR